MYDEIDPEYWMSMWRMCFGKAGRATERLVWLCRDRKRAIVAGSVQKEGPDGRAGGLQERITHL